MVADSGYPADGLHLFQHGSVSGGQPVESLPAIFFQELERKENSQGRGSRRAERHLRQVGVRHIQETSVHLDYDVYLLHLG